MKARVVGFKLVLLISVVLIGLCQDLAASAEQMPFNCVILPGGDEASILMTNSLDRDASCIVTCKFSTTKYDNNPQITCAKPIPAGKEVEMCLLTSGGNKMMKLTEGHAECTN
jgi:hypothetical protein